MSPNRALVWDLPTRLFHWTLVLLVALQYASGEFGWLDLQWHVPAGYAALALLLFRAAWGFVGSDSARFAQFLRGPGAIRRYLRADDPSRIVVPLQIRAHAVLNMTGNPALSVVWQDIRAAGQDAPTWLFSDAARAAGAQRLLYSSRSRPDLTHLVLFDPGVIRCVGPAQAFPSQA